MGETWGEKMKAAKNRRGHMIIITYLRKRSFAMWTIYGKNPDA